VDIRQYYENLDVNPVSKDNKTDVHTLSGMPLLKIMMANRELDIYKNYTKINV
jgi:hypothetical protein